MFAYILRTKDKPHKYSVSLTVNSNDETYDSLLFSFPLIDAKRFTKPQLDESTLTEIKEYFDMMFYLKE